MSYFRNSWREALLDLPKWPVQFLKFVVIGALLVLVSQSYLGNQLQCYILGDSGCKAVLTLESEYYDVNLVELKELDPSIITFKGENPSEYNCFGKTKLTVENIGVVHVERLSLAVNSNCPSCEGILGYRIVGISDIPGDSPSEIIVERNAYSVSEWFALEKTDLEIYVAGKSGKPVLNDIILTIKCHECRIPITREEIDVGLKCN